MSIAAAVMLFAAAAVLTAVSFRTDDAAARLIEKYRLLTAGCSEYSACVLDIHREEILMKNGRRRRRRVMILQFRSEREKRTIVHKCTCRFFGIYSRDDRIKLLFREGAREDFSVPAEDNGYLMGVFILRRAKLPCRAAAAVFAVMGIILLL